MTRHLVDLYPWMLLVACLAATAFPVMYLFGSPWWETVFGRAFMASRLSVAIALDETWVFQKFTSIPLPVELWIAYFTFIFIIAASLAMAYLLWKAQHQGHPISKAMREIDPNK